MAEAVVVERKLACQQLESVEAAFKSEKTRAESAEAKLDEVTKRAAAAEKGLAILSEKGPGKQGTRKSRKRNKSRAARAKKAAWLQIEAQVDQEWDHEIEQEGEYEIEEDGKDVIGAEGVVAIARTNQCSNVKVYLQAETGDRITSVVSDLPLLMLGSRRM
jgi:hypothetical protein